jgi:hypothetical protein
VIHKHDYLGMPWYWLSRVYLNERVSKVMFEKQMRYARRRKGALDAGVYRHGKSDGPMVYITAVSHKTEGLAELAPLLLGEDVLQDRANIEALIARRVRVLEDLIVEGAKGGSYRIHHGAAQHLSRSGEMEDDR